MWIEENCPKCGNVLRRRRNPVPTVDLIIEIPNQGLILIQRVNPPLGWALPGGYVDYGESLEDAARREAREETSLEVELLGASPASWTIAWEARRPRYRRRWTPGST